MKNILKIGLTLIGGLIVYKGIQLFNSFTLFEDLSISAEKVNIKTSLSDGITVMVTPSVKNPTKHTLTITQPFVKLFSNGTEVSTSNIQNKTHILKPLQQSFLDSVTIKLSWEQVIQIAEKIKITIPKGTVSTKILYLIAHTKDILNQSKLTIQVITYANNVYYKSDHIEVKL